MRVMRGRLTVLLGAVLFSAVQCGFSADMLTTASLDSETGTATESGEGSDGDTGSDSAVCRRGETLPSEVVLIGDSWIALSELGVGELAKASGVLKSDEDYGYRAITGSTIGAIVQQYANYVAMGDTTVKVVIMNGGAVDTYGALGAESSILDVVDTFKTFLEQLADEGSVEHVIYVLYAEGTAIPGVAELRSPMASACADSTVPCHFIDLQPLWAGHLAEYMSIENINPSAAGAEVIAAAIWQTMQEKCIAQ